MTNQFKLLFLIRFSSYLFIFIGILAISFQFGPLALAEYSYRKDRLFGINHRLAPTITRSVDSQPTASPNIASQGFGSISSSNSNFITPVSTDYGIVIEKINANSRVIPDIDPTNQAQYIHALAAGVAEAKGSTKPGQVGNLYIFSHSADAPWNVTRFNAVFYLLRELEKGDSVNLFYQGRRYDYVIFDKVITDPSDISFLANRYDAPVLTLQTCDPPGTLNHRLIVRAKLLGS